MRKSIEFNWDRRYISGFIVAGFEAFAAVALLATSAYLISRASEQPPILYLMVAVVGVRAFALGRAASRYLQRLILHDSVFRSLTNLRPVLYRKLAELVPGVISSRSKALDAFTTDVERLQDYPLRVLIPLIQAIAAVATMFAISIWAFAFAAVQLALIALAFMVVVLLLSWRAVSNLEIQRANASSELNQKILGYLSNVDVLTSYRWSAGHLARIYQQANQIERLDRKRVFPGALAVGLLGFGSVVTAAAGGFTVADSMEQILPSVLAVAVLMPLAVFDVFAQLQSVAASWSSYRSASDRLADVMDRKLPKELAVRDGQSELADFSQLTLTDLAIRRGDKEVLKGISHTFRQGQMSSIIGPSGVGKSSLALALCSLIQPESGQISVDAESLSSFKLRSRRSKIVLIEQQPHIFRGTVRQNLQIAGEVDDEELVLALRTVGLDYEFESRGLLDAELSEDAGNVSGGQAQRLAIARGIIAGAKVLILDEPTSGLDMANSLALMEILRQLAARGMIVILITHDPQLQALCDETLDLTNFGAQ